ncbi:hypothetical protein [Micavibrio aeruginosavorus]|uniref:Uncharacterized protein n=1 Tax=Micavibrio aeruginosavorus EPB TaxID=349215 RepID=M4VZP6_9BACT|nr:hypothetical protein [Micavibrio aeruginosavorus]AGH98659.1 hypothetical protein A11S_1857 [Micavibrio aeruginosavorus EPB]
MKQSKVTLGQTALFYATMLAIIWGAHLWNEDKREQDARDNANPDVIVDKYCERLTRDASAFHTQFTHRATGEAKGALFELTKDDCLKIMAEKKAAASSAPAPK